jgi:hypothetical protein
MNTAVTDSIIRRVMRAMMYLGVEASNRWWEVYVMCNIFGEGSSERGFVAVRGGRVVDKSFDTSYKFSPRKRRFWGEVVDTVVV